MISAEEKQAKSLILQNAIEDLIRNFVIEDELVSPRTHSVRKTVSKNAHPITKYVHRIIAFYTGWNSTIPAMNDFNLQDFADIVFNQKGLKWHTPEYENKYTVYLINNGVEKITKMLDDYAMSLIAQYNLPLDGISQWKRAFYG